MHRVHGHNGATLQWFYHCCNKEFRNGKQALAHRMQEHGQTNRAASKTLDRAGTASEQHNCKFCAAARRQAVQVDTDTTDLLEEVWDWWNFREPAELLDVPEDSLAGERRLLQALLDRVLDDAMGGGKYAAIRQAALDWLLEPHQCRREFCTGIPVRVAVKDPETVPRAYGAGFSASEVLDLLGLDESATRAIWRKQFAEKETDSHAST